MSRLPLSFFGRWLLRLLLGRDDRRNVTSDLLELYEMRRRRDGERAAVAWLRRQSSAYPFHLLSEFLRRAFSMEPDPRPKFSTGAERRASEATFDLLRDLRHSARRLVRSPGLTLTIVLTVGLGIGASTAIFSVVDTVLLRSLPYPNAEQLVRIYTDAPPHRWRFSVADYLALREQQTSFAGVASYENVTMTFVQDDVAERLQGKRVSPSYFSVLGVRPQLGRMFEPADGIVGGERRVVVSHDFWMRYLAADEQVIGRPVELDGESYVVAGVLPDGGGPYERQRAFFLAAQYEAPPRRGPFFLTAIGRLRPDVEPAAAAAELHSINRRIFPIWQETYQDERATWNLMDLKEDLIGDVDTTLALVLGAVAFLLLIASVNAANLLLARATQRSRELAVRSALGATRGQLLRHLLLESLLLAVASGVVGIVIGLGGTQILRTAGGDFLPRAYEISYSPRVLAFLAATTAVSGLLFGLLPALFAITSGLRRELRTAERTVSDDIGSQHLRHALVVGQFAVATPLVVGAGLLTVSMLNLQRVDPGFDTENLLTANIALSDSTYPERPDASVWWNTLHERIAALPGVLAVASADSRPPRRVGMINNFDLEDRPTPAGASQPSVPWVTATPEYFATLGVPLLAGRLYDERDAAADAPPVVVVDRAWAERFFPGQHAVGRRLRDGGCTDCPWTTVIGVVGDVKHTGLDDPGQGTVYGSITGGPPWVVRNRFLLLRTTSDAASFVPVVRNLLRQLDPAVPLSRLATIDELMVDSLEKPRYLALLVGIFATVSLLLSLIGIYGVMSYFVLRRHKDIGIRLALGGQPTNILSMILGQGLRLIAIGVAIGIAGALLITRFLSSLLFDVTTTDATVFGSVTTLLLAVALFACLIPARRAAGLDPGVTLREE